MMIVCPHCRQTLPAANSSSDIMHECNTGTNAIDNEDKVDLTATLPFAGVENRLFGTFASHDRKARNHTVNGRGNRTTTHRTRQRQVFINIKDGTYGLNPEA